MAGIRVLHSNCRLNIQDRGYQARPLRVINMRIAKTLGFDVLLQLQQRAENDALTKFLLHLRTTGYVLLAHLGRDNQLETRSVDWGEAEALTTPWLWVLLIPIAAPHGTLLV